MCALGLRQFQANPLTNSELQSSDVAHDALSAVPLTVCPREMDPSIVSSRDASAVGCSRSQEASVAAAKAAASAGAADSTAGAEASGEAEASA
eukprot:CAMPEP_0115302364 /NCGR_PEP_ID=MMETSP0270-20121206/70345_1 /TAXON_ID=71861 /ORGANISM="Scrippsiella trochoidea, Strain CCMP3099" /LENGTH=92 /DNA_ID=CAMNT_0002720289 /DNA_START=73 /DNA_END=348 /DNA_ORIENTATION=+